MWWSSDLGEFLCDGPPDLGEFIFMWRSPWFGWVLCDGRPDLGEFLCDGLPDLSEFLCDGPPDLGGSVESANFLGKYRAIGFVEIG